LTPSTTIALKDSILFERKLETVTEGLTREYRNLFNILSKEDALTLMDYVISLKTEINPSDNYRKSVIKIIDYLDHEHPQPGNPNAIFLSGNRKSLGRTIGIKAVEIMYKRYRTRFFPRLLESPTVLPEDKPKIRELLKKPWNPYIQRHSSLTDKSKILKEHLLRQHAGWSIGSDMPLKYLHYLGNESSESLLEAYGIMPKGQNIAQLKPKQCPNCMEPNKPESRFCGKCRMVLTYDAYSETVEEKQQKESEVKELKEKYEQEMKSMREEIREEMRVQLAQLVTQLKPEVIREGLS
jgi:hypothetical protein